MYFKYILIKIKRETTLFIKHLSWNIYDIYIYMYISQAIGFNNYTPLWNKIVSKGIKNLKLIFHEIQKTILRKIWLNCLPLYLEKVFEKEGRQC